MLKKGIFVVFEGIDGSGKSTQINRLYDYFTEKNIGVSKFREPTDGQYGSILRGLAVTGRNITAEEELDLFIKDRIEDCRINVAPALARNEVVLMDRYYLSSVAYQGAFGLDPEYILKRHMIKEILTPDLILYFDCPVEISIQRITKKRGESLNHFEKKEYLEKVREIYLRYSTIKNLHTIDATVDTSSIFDLTKSKIIKNLE